MSSAPAWRSWLRLGEAPAAPPEEETGQLPREAVLWAFRLLLGREPSREEVAAHRRHPSLDVLRDALTPPAPRERRPPRYDAPLWLLAPPRSPRLPWRAGPPSLARPVSQLCTASQLDEPDYARWCAAVGERPRPHRKQWEFCWILAAAEAGGVLREGARALGFGTGREPIPSALAARGLSVVATDAPPEVVAGQGWEATGQRADGLMALHKGSLIGEAAFRERVSFRFADMNDVPSDLAGFDLCWSSCCFEHLGGIEAGLRFVERSVGTLAPGGLALHTTEFNLGSDDDTLETPGLSLFRRRDIEALLERLARAGHEVWPLCLHPGHAPLDAHVDAPPYAEPHLKLRASGYVTTSIGLAVRRAA